MPRKRTPILTEAELRVMGVVWDKGAVSVRDVTDALARKYKLAYTTVLTVLRVLTDKGFVSAEADGRAHIYSAKVTREQARSLAVKHLVQSFFADSKDAFAQHLIDTDTIDVERLRKIEADIRKRGKYDA